MSDQDYENTEPYAAYFLFDSPPAPETCVFRLTDSEKIQQARDILDGKEKNQIHVTGIIVKARAPYNPDWSFHYDSESIEFFEFSIEVCDAAIKYVEEHLEEVGGAFLPDNRWCPWGSRLLKEITWL
jgi:hypothetical protein